jgi:hypothetical protein
VAFEGIYAPGDTLPSWFGAVYAEKFEFVSEIIKRKLGLGRISSGRISLTCHCAAKTTCAIKPVKNR